jgi:excisionase family DNA binding protein
MSQTICMNYSNRNMQQFNFLPENSYTPVQVAELLGVKPATVYAWLSRKELMGNKVGHKRYITEKQLKRFYEQRMSNVIIDYT